MKEIRLHGIGGLGTVKAGEMLVHAAVASGKYGNSIPFFGFERQGAPVTSYVRLGDEKIRPKNQVYHPNCTLVLDPSLLISAPVFDGLTENSYFIVNTKAENGADLVKNPNVKTVAWLDATSSALRCWAVPSPTPSCLGRLRPCHRLGGQGRAERIICRFFGEKNVETFRRGYNEVKLYNI